MKTTMKSLKTSFAILTTIAATATACGTSNDSSDTEVGVPDVSVDVGVDSSQVDAEQADLGSDVEDVTPQVLDPCGKLDWTDAGDAAFSPRDHHATFVTSRDGQPQLHVVGGTNYQTVFDDHWIADIQPDGSLSSWRNGVSLPAPRSGQAVVSTGDDVWLIAGRPLGQLRADTYRANWDGGEISGWSTEAPIPEPRFHTSGVIADGRLWVVGGIGQDGSAQSTVFASTLDAQGAASEWETLSLPESLSHHGAFVKDAEVYLTFGFSGTPQGNNTDPYFGIVKFDTSTGPNIELTDFWSGQEDYAAMSATVTGDCFRTFGGLTIDEVSGSPKYQAETLRFDFTTGEQTYDSKFETGRSHMHQVPYYNGAFYVTAGSIGLQNVTSSVEIGRVD